MPRKIHYYLRYIIIIKVLFFLSFGRRTLFSIFHPSGRQRSLSLGLVPASVGNLGKPLTHLIKGRKFFPVRLIAQKPICHPFQTELAEIMGYQTRLAQYVSSVSLI